MDCKEAQSLVQAYVEKKIPMHKLREFIEHVNHCPQCYDELETYYTIFYAIKYLDEDSHVAFNTNKMLREDLEKQMQRAKKHRQKRIFFWVLLILITFCATFLLISVFLPEVVLQFMDYMDLMFAYVNQWQFR